MWGAHGSKCVGGNGAPAQAPQVRRARGSLSSGASSGAEPAAEAPGRRLRPPPHPRSPEWGSPSPPPTGAQKARGLARRAAATACTGGSTRTEAAARRGTARRRGAPCDPTSGLRSSEARSPGLGWGPSRPLDTGSVHLGSQWASLLQPRRVTRSPQSPCATGGRDGARQTPGLLGKRRPLRGDTVPSPPAAGCYSRTGPPHSAAPSAHVHTRPGRESCDRVLVHKGLAGGRSQKFWKVRGREPQFCCSPGRAAPQRVRVGVRARRDSGLALGGPPDAPRGETAVRSEVCGSARRGHLKIRGRGARRPQRPRRHPVPTWGDPDALPGSCAGPCAQDPEAARPPPLSPWLQAPQSRGGLAGVSECPRVASAVRGASRRRRPLLSPTTLVPCTCKMGRPASACRGETTAPSCVRDVRTGTRFGAPRA